jgi:thioredoxin:protein disulfide reductase
MRQAVLGLVTLAVAGCRWSEVPPVTPGVPTVTLEPAVASPARAPPPEPTIISWERSESRALERARADARPLLIYFTAAWCAACMELEKTTFKDRRVVAATARFVPLWIDATDDDDQAIQAIKSKLKVVGLPTVVALDTSGQERKRINEFISAQALVTALRSIE